MKADLSFPIGIHGDQHPGTQQQLSVYIPVMKPDPSGKKPIGKCGRSIKNILQISGKTIGEKSVLAGGKMRKLNDLIRIGNAVSCGINHFPFTDLVKYSFALPGKSPFQVAVAVKIGTFVRDIIYICVKIIPGMQQVCSDTDIQNTVTRCFRAYGIVKLVDPVLSKQVIANRLIGVKCRSDQFKGEIL